MTDQPNRAGARGAEAAPSAPDLETLEAFRAELLAGLARTPKAVSPRFFYDAAGTELFNRITELDEYYPTRTELAILSGCASEIAQAVGPGATVVEFGAGAPDKAVALLDILDAPAGYRTIDISAQAVEDTIEGVGLAFPELSLQGVVGDFNALAASDLDMNGRNVLGFFPGSTIGNLTPRSACRLLETMRLLLAGGDLLVGADTKKDPAELIRAYDDREGVTALFNKNMLVRANRELGADFDLDAFAHEARWNEELGRVEMHLRSLKRQSVHLAGRRFEFEAGETLHTESSYKYAPGEFSILARAAGWLVSRRFHDPDQRFGLYLLSCNGV